MQEQLTAANQAYSDLVSGRAARVYVDSNGERIEYNPGSAPRLYALILMLQAAIDAGRATFVAPVQRPMRPFF